MTGNASSSSTWVMKLIQVNIGMRISVMPGARMLTIVDEEVDRRRQRRDAEDLEAEHPEVDVQPGRVLPRGQVGVAEPAAVGRRAEQEARVEEQAAEQEHPVAERVEPRERHVARADLQRDHEVEERGRRAA